MKHGKFLTLVLAVAFSAIPGALAAPLAFNPSIQIPSLDEVIPPDQQAEADALRLARFSNLSFEGLPTHIDFRDRATSIKTQNQPWCTAYGLVAVLEINSGEVDPDLSERHLWSMYKKYSCRVAIRKSWGRAITTEDYWPIGRRRGYRGYKDAAKLYVKEYDYLDNDIRKALEAMAAGRAVYVGMSVSESMGRCDVMLDAKSKNNGGGHAIAAVGYQLDAQIPGGGAFLIKNSWGDDCADRGFQWVPFGYCERKDSYCVFWDVTQTGRMD